MTSKDSTGLKNSISNWAKTGARIYKEEDCDAIHELLLAEVAHYDRPYNKKRLYSRFNHLRRIDETRDLRAFFRSRIDICAIARAAEEEYRGRNRYHIIRKLYGFFSAERSKEEKKQYDITE